MGSFRGKLIRDLSGTRYDGCVSRVCSKNLAVHRDDPLLSGGGRALLRGLDERSPWLRSGLVSHAGRPGDVHCYAQRLRRFAERQGWCMPGLADGIMQGVLRLLATSDSDHPSMFPRDLIAYGLRRGEPACGSTTWTGRRRSCRSGRGARITILSRAASDRRSCVTSPMFVSQFHGPRSTR